MSNAKRRTLIAIQAILIAVFIIAILSLSFGNAKAEESDVSAIVQESIDAREQIENLAVGGKLEAHDAAKRYADEGISAIGLSTAAQVQSFLKGEYPAETAGYLTGPITSYSWDGFFTKQIMAADKIFDGNGYSITLDATWINSLSTDPNTPWASFGDIYNSAVNTFFKASDPHTDLDLNGAFVGYIPPSSSVVNTQFIVSTSIFTYSGTYQDGVTLQSSDGKHNSVATSASGCGGYVAAYCSGTIDNCSITLNENVYLRILKASSAGKNTMSRNSYALGGMVGVLAGPAATVSNCKVDLKRGSLLFLEINAGGKNDARAYVGGIIGWMGDGSKAYNLYCEGSGTLRGTTSGSSNTPYPLTFTGIAVGSAGATQDGAAASDVTGTKTAGTINGVISSWTGMAYFRSNDATYSMTGEASNSTDYSLQGVVIGCEGKANDTTYKATNIYFLGNPNYITIGYSYTVAAVANSAASGRAIRTCNSVSVRETADSSTTYTTSSSDRVALRFSSTEADSTIWATYDLSGDSSHIFWAITADKSGGTLNATTEYTKYFCQFEKAEDAMDYDFAFVELVRGRYSTVEIGVELGRALYYDSSDSATFESLAYGNQLSLPDLTFWTDAEHKNSAGSDLSCQYSYCRTVLGSSSQPIASSGYKDVGVYTTFIYTEQAIDGSNYNDIDLLDESKRIVTYIQDNDYYKTYKEAHESYEYIDPRTGIKDFDTWQPKYTQTIVPKVADLSIEKPADKNIPITNGVYKASYESMAIDFSCSIKQSDLVVANGDTFVEVTLKYYRTDDNFNYNPATDEVTSMKNAGKYMIVADTVKNSNYTFDKEKSSSYAKLEISKRPTMVEMNENFEYEPVAGAPDTYKIYLKYTGSEQIIKYSSGYTLNKAEMTQNNWAFYFYNVIVDPTNGIDDSPMIQIDVMGMDGSDVYNAYDVPEDGENGSYKVVISFADGQASSNYELPSKTTFIVEITPIEIAFEEKTKEQSTFIYGDVTPESDEQRGYFAFALDNGVQIEPTSRTYKIWDDSVGDYVDYGESPRNVGKYQIIYKVEHAVERNYSDTTKIYEVEILPRPVTYTMTNTDAIDDGIYGRDYTPGMGDDKSMIAGNFDKYKSTQVNDLNGTGLSTTHGSETIVGYRYQRIGNYGDAFNFQPLTDMNDIALLPDKIQDAGNYVIYPIILFPAVGGGYEYDAEQANNYVFKLEYKTFAVAKLEISIILEYEFTKEYSKELPTYNGAANDETDRIWKYATGSNEFLEADEIEVYLTFYANADSVVGDYKVTYAGCKGLKAFNDEGLNKADNYTVKAEGIIKLEITALEVSVKVFADNNKITYGDALPKFSYQVAGENGFTEFDLEDMTATWTYYVMNGAQVDELKNAGYYEIGVEFDSDNYKVVESRAIITIAPKTISVTNVEVDHAGATAVYDGKVHYPTITNIEFDGLVDGDDIIVSFVFYDQAGKKVENPQNAGVYTAKIEAGVSVLNADDLSVNNNYVLDEVGSASATVVISKRSVVVTVANGQMFYLDPDSLTAVGQDYDYSVTGGDGFVDELEYKLIPVDSNYAAGTHANGVSIEFLGDAASNYDVTVIKGELEVVNHDITGLGKYVQITYDGLNYEEVKDGVVYTGANLYNKFDFATTALLSDKLSMVITTDANGSNRTTQIVNAGTYYMVISSSDGELSGQLILEFKVAPAQQIISEADIKLATHYNKLVFTSSVANLQYSVNGGIFIDAVNGVYECDATPLSNYSIQVRVKRGINSNYADSNVITIYTATGINVGDIMEQIDAIEEIDFSNVAAYRELLERLNNVGEDDKSLIDTAKIAALENSLQELIAQANSVISGAQSVTAKAVGRSSSSTAATSLAVTATGLGLSAVGLMLGFVSVKKRKEDEEVSGEVKSKSVNFKKSVKVIAVVLIVALIAVFALAACQQDTITQEDVLALASFKTPSNENSRAYEITVTYGSEIVYQNINGKVESIDLITPPDFNLGSSGSGFDFNEDYFTNVSFITSRTTATFSADVEDVSSFLGRPNAENAKVTVVVDILHERLSEIRISYDEGGFSTQIVSSMIY